MDFKKLVKIIYATVSALTLASTIFLLVSFTSSFDMINGYFIDGILPILFNIFFILGIVLSFLCVFTFRKRSIIKTKNETSKEKYIYLALAGALLICSIVLMTLAENTNLITSAVGVIFFAAFITSCVFKNGYEYSHAKLMILLLSALFPLFMVMDNNSALFRHSNSVENMLSSVFGISFLVYILYEGKRLFTGEHSKWHFASMLLLTHTGFSLSISYIIVYLTGTATETIRFYQMILIFIVCLFAEIELIKFVREAQSLTQEEWTKIENFEEKEKTDD